jgi:hypothetical protein
MRPSLYRSAELERLGIPSAHHDIDNLITLLRKSIHEEYGVILKENLDMDADAAAELIIYLIRRKIIIPENLPDVAAA